MKSFLPSLLLSAAFLSITVCVFAQQPAEKPGCGVVVVRHDENKAIISWRLLKSDPEGNRF